MTRTAEQTWQTYLEIWSGLRPVSELPEVLADDYAGQVGALPQDATQLASRIEVYRLAHPGAAFEVLEQIAAGDRLVTRMRVTGLTGSDVPVYGINIGRHADGRLAQEWAVWESP